MEDIMIRENASESRKYRDLIIDQIRNELNVSEDRVNKIIRILNKSSSDDLRRLYETFERFGVQTIFDIINE